MLDIKLAKFPGLQLLPFFIKGQVEVRTWIEGRNKLANLIDTHRTKRDIREGEIEETAGE